MAAGLQKTMEVFTDHPGNRNEPLDLVLLLSYSAPIELEANILGVTDAMKQVYLRTLTPCSLTVSFCELMSFFFFFVGVSCRLRTSIQHTILLSVPDFGTPLIKMAADGVTLSQKWFICLQKLRPEYRMPIWYDNTAIITPKQQSGVTLRYNLFPERYQHNTNRNLCRSRYPPAEEGGYVR